MSKPKAESASGILHRRYIKGDQRREADLERERVNDRVANMNLNELIAHLRQSDEWSVLSSRSRNHLTRLFDELEAAREVLQGYANLDAHNHPQYESEAGTLLERWEK